MHAPDGRTNHQHNSRPSRQRNIGQSAKRQEGDECSGQRERMAAQKTFDGYGCSDSGCNTWDTDFAPCGRNRGTTILHATIKFIVLGHC